jgi:hypothetical protein
MASFGRVRLGLTVRNVNEVTFGTGVNAETLERSARAGAAFSTGTRGVIGTATIAFDADLNRTPTVFGDERRMALGGEAWTAKKTFGVRGGANVNTIGDRRTALSAGVSVMLRSRTFVDAEATGGTDAGRRGWSADLRLTF